MQHKNHEVSIAVINKIGLSPLDTKRYYIDNIYSRPFGHWRNEESTRCSPEGSALALAQ